MACRRIDLGHPYYRRVPQWLLDWNAQGIDPEKHVDPIGERSDEVGDELQLTKRQCIRERIAVSIDPTVTYSNVRHSSRGTHDFKTVARESYQGVSAVIEGVVKLFPGHYH